jgi:hypothetical protein
VRAGLASDRSRFDPKRSMPDRRRVKGFEPLKVIEKS